MRLLINELDKRATIKLNKNIKVGNTNGIMDFGDNNDYPQIIERIFNESISATSIANIFAKFLVGKGFENPLINNQVIGKDIRGTYVHIAETIDMVAKEVKHIPFKYCRFTKKDDTGYCAKVAVYDNWEKDSIQKFEKEKINSYPIWNKSKEAFDSNIQACGGFEKFTGRVNYLFFDNQYLYPLSPIDTVYMDSDSEAQISIFKNNQLRNGFLDKTILRVQPPSTEKEREEFISNIKKSLGVDGDPVLTLEDEVDENGEIKKTGAFALDTLKSTINDKLFENWEKSLRNNIRIAYWALPALLVDYEESKLGTTSGEAINQAVKFYNAITKDFRSEISEFFKEIFSNFDNDILANNQNWDIKELELYASNIPTATGL
jgi:hypothetical protein